MSKLYCDRTGAPMFLSPLNLWCHHTGLSPKACEPCFTGIPCRCIARPLAKDSRFLQMYGMILWASPPSLITCPAHSSCLSSLVYSALLSSLRLLLCLGSASLPQKEFAPRQKIGDHSSVLPIFQCPKAIASYILSSLWLFLWEGKSPSYSIEDGSGSSMCNFCILIPDDQG